MKLKTAKFEENTELLNSLYRTVITTKGQKVNGILQMTNCLDCKSFHESWSHPSRTESRLVYCFVNYLTELLWICIYFLKNTV